MSAGNSVSASLQACSGLSGAKAFAQPLRNGRPVQALMVLELAALLGAEEHEHREERLSYRNGWGS